MIIEVPQPLEPFHIDPDWKDWTSFFVWLNQHEAQYFLEELMTDQQLRKRFLAFLQAAISCEEKIQVALEQRISSSDPPSPELCKLQIPIQPKSYSNFNDVYGKWELFVECMITEYPNLSALLDQLRYSRSFRQSVLDFLTDSFAFEDKVAQEYHEVLTS